MRSYVLILIFLLTLGISQPSSADSQPSQDEDIGHDRQVADRLVEERLERLDKQSKQTDSVDIYNQELLLLMDVMAEQNMDQYFAPVAQRVVEGLDKRALPALERFIRREKNSPDTTRHAQDMLRAYHDDASAVWLDIMWQDASDFEKAQTAFQGLRLDSDLPLDPHVSSARLGQFGVRSRKTIYDFLLSPDPLDHTISGWSVNACTQLARLLSLEGLSPTPHEVEKILSQDNAYAIQVLITYLVAQDDDRAASALVKWLDKYHSEEDSVGVMCALSAAGRTKNLSEQARQEIRHKVIEIAGFPWSSEPFNDKSSIDQRMLGQIHYALYQLGDSKETRDYFVKYKEIKRRYLESRNLGNSVQWYADIWMEDALSKWKPDTQDQ